MKKFAPVIIAVVAILAIGLLYKFKGSKPQTKKEYVFGYPLKFEYKEPTAKGAAATIFDKVITEKELIDRSAALDDYTSREVAMLVKAAVEKAKQDKSTKFNIEVFAVRPKSFDQKKVIGDLENFTLAINEPTPEAPLVKINGKSYNRAELRTLNQIDYSTLRTKLFREKLRILTNLFMNRLLLQSAKQEKLTIESFIKQKITNGEIEVTDREIYDFAYENNMRSQVKDPQFRDRLSMIVKERKRKRLLEEFASKTYADQRGLIHFLPSTYTIPLNETKALITQRAKGDNTPTFLVFSGLGCNPCTHLANELDAIRKEIDDTVRIGFVNFFSKNDWPSYLLAQSAQCLNYQGTDYFWEFYNKMAERLQKEHKSASEDLIFEVVKTTKADFENFKKCVVEKKFDGELDKQIRYAKDLGVNVQPTIVIGSEVFTGRVDRTQLLQAINHLKWNQ